MMSSRCYWNSICIFQYCSSLYKAADRSDVAYRSVALVYGRSVFHCISYSVFGRWEIRNKDSAMNVLTL